MTHKPFTIGDSFKAKLARFDSKYMRVSMDLKNQAIISYFYDLLTAYWKKNHKGKKKLDTIFFNKVVAEVTRNDDSLNFITRGWYLYGIVVGQPLMEQLSAIPSIKEITNFTDFKDLTNSTGFKAYAEVTEFTEDELISKGEKLIAAADRFDCNTDSHTWQHIEYEDFGRKIYIARLDLLEALTGRNAEKIDQKLSSLALALDLEISDYKYPLGCETLMHFVDTAQKVILTNNSLIRDYGLLTNAFEKSWRNFACVSLYLTSEGINQEELKALGSSHIAISHRAAMRAIGELAGGIDYENFSLEINPNSHQKKLLKSIHRIKNG